MVPVVSYLFNNDNGWPQDLKAKRGEFSRKLTVATGFIKALKQVIARAKAEAYLRQQEETEGRSRWT